MEVNNWLLFSSILLNILLFRWAVSEYIRRRKYQKQSVALAEVLEAVHHKKAAPIAAEVRAAGWFFVGFLLLIGMLVSILYY